MKPPADIAPVFTWSYVLEDVSLSHMAQRCPSGERESPADGGNATLVDASRHSDLRRTEAPSVLNPLGRSLANKLSCID